MDFALHVSVRVLLLLVRICYFGGWVITMNAKSENNQNPAKGRQFQKLAADVLAQHFRAVFTIDKPIPIGHPQKNHKFDLVSSCGHYIGECKNYSWTGTGNIPSAKMGFCNEAAFYLTFLDSQTVRFIAMRKDTHPKRTETLAEYYYRINRHLLGDIFVLEIDITDNTVRPIGKTISQER